MGMIICCNSGNSVNIKHSSKSYMENNNYEKNETNIKITSKRNQNIVNPVRERKGYYDYYGKEQL